MSNDGYLIWSHEHSAWWGPDGSGYVQRISQAGRYSREEAISICISALRPTASRFPALPELPVRLADLVDMIAAYFGEFASRPESWR